MRNKIVIAFISLLMLDVSAVLSQEIMKERPMELSRVDVNEQLGKSILTNISFKDENGKEVWLRDYFDGKIPAVLNLAYYKCPMLCGLLMNGLAETIRQTSLELGRDYLVITVSIDPSETSELAMEKKVRYSEMLGREKNSMKWSFLTGNEESIKTLAKLVGFDYYYDSEKKEYAHPAVLTILSPEGKVIRYLYGIEFKSDNFKLSLVEASEGKVGTITDRIILSCYQYDPNSKSYAPVARNVMKLGGALMVLIMCLTFGVIWARKGIKNTRQKEINSN